MLNLAIPAARDMLLATLQDAGVVPTIEYLLARGGRPILFAGAVRDSLILLEQGKSFGLPRDLDIGVAGLERSKFHWIVRDIGGALNRHGGYKLIREGLPAVDLWRLEDTLGLRVFGAHCTIANVLRTFVIDLNAVAFDAHTGRFEDRGSIKSLQSRRIGLVQDALVHSTDTFAAKALVAALKFSLPVSPPLDRLVHHFLTQRALAHETGKVFDQKNILPLYKAVHR